MANAKIQWTQNVAGRSEGQIETVEIDTPFMKGCLANRRFVVLEEAKPGAPKPKAPKGGVEAEGRTWV